MGTTLAFDLIAHDKASDKFDKVGTSADRSSGKLKKFAKVGALAVAAGAVVAGKALFDMTKAAMDDQKAQAILAKQLKNSAGATDSQVKSVEKYITAQGKNLGITDDELRPALGRLVTATKDVSKAQDLAALAMDISAAKGKPLKTVTEALAKAQEGNIGALGRLGVKTKDAEGKTKSLKDITQDLANTYQGQAANAANTTAGKFGRLKLQFDETRESIGAKLLPIAAKLADWLLNKGVPAATKLGHALGEKLGPIISKVGGWIKSDLLPAMQKLWKDVAPGLKQVMSAVGDELHSAAPLFKLLGRVVTNVLLPGLGILYKTALPILAKGLRLTGKLLGAIGRAGVWMWNNALQPVFVILGKAIGRTLVTFGNMLKLIGKAPGMGWVGRLGDKMVNAGKKADGLSDKIRKIPDGKAKINLDTSAATAALNAWLAAANNHAVRVPVYRSGATPGGKAPHNARGTSHWRGGGTWVGEHGPEFVDLPRGSRVHPNEQSQRMGGGMSEATFLKLLTRALESMQVVRLPDAGRQAYRMGGF